MAVGQTVDVGLYAVSDDESDQAISGMNVVLTWDSEALRLEGELDNGPYNWMMSGFLGDPLADGLNDSLLDGDALYQAVSNFTVPAVATAEGLLVTTFRFTALTKTAPAVAVIEPWLGDYSRTQVFKFGAINVDIKGMLGTAQMTILGVASITASDVWLPAGRTAQVLVSGELDDRMTFGVAVLVELVPREDAAGTVAFTPAPPDDIIQAGDPWPEAGQFTTFDTDFDTDTASSMINGSVDDNGSFEPAPLTFRGALSAFPVLAEEDASGVWDIRLVAGEGAPSFWWGEEIATTLGEGTLRIVDPADGNDSGTIDLFDFSEFMTCFTGPGGSPDGPIYSLAPRLRCVVYDLDEDGDVDNGDYALFHKLMSSPGF